MSLFHPSRLSRSLFHSSRLSRTGSFCPNLKSPKSYIGLNSLGGKFPVAPNGMPNIFYTNSSQEEKRLQTLLSSFILKTLNKTDVLHACPDGKTSMSDFFLKIRQEIEKNNPNATLYVSGGVVRALLGYTYARLYAEHRIHHSLSQEKSTEEILKEITDKDGRHTLWDVFGIGSDLDLLVDGMSKEAAEACLHSFSPAGEKSQRLSHLHYDINEYEPQITRSTNQGGSSLDYLAFSLRPEEGFRSPDSVPLIMPNFLQGRVSILPMDRAESKPITTARLIRTFLEIPFLQPAPEDMSLTTTAVKKLAKEFSELDPFTKHKVKEQFRKAELNCRFSQACNFVAKQKPNSPLLESAWQSMPEKLIHEFLENKEIRARPEGFDPGELRAKGILVTLEEFVSKYTDNGLLYHGTPDSKNLLPMLRTGLHVSSLQQGRAVYGRGFYTTKDRAVSSSYATKLGCILELAINTSSQLRILDLERCPKNIVEEAEKQKQDLHEYLEQVYHVDIIINGYILVQNMDALILPENVQEWLSMIQNSIMNRISQLNESQMMDEDFRDVWINVKNSDNISWMLHHNIPLTTKFIKLVLSWYKKNAITTQKFLEFFEMVQCTSEIQEKLSNEDLQDVKECLHMVQNPIIDRISEIKELEVLSEYILKNVQSEVKKCDILHKHFYGTRPISEQLIKAVLPWYKIDGYRDKLLSLLEQMELIHTNEFAEEVLNQINAAILSGSELEQKSLKNLLESIKGPIHPCVLTKDRIESLIISWLPLKEHGFYLIREMLDKGFFQINSEIIEVVINALIPSLKEKKMDPQKFRSAYRMAYLFYSKSIRFYNKEKSVRESFNKLIPIFLSHAKDLFSGEDLEGIRSFVRKTPDINNFSFWIPKDQIIDFLNNAFERFIQKKEKNTQLLCLDLLRTIVKEEKNKISHYNTQDWSFANSIDCFDDELESPNKDKIIDSFIRLLTQNPDLLADPDVQKFCTDTFKQCPNVISILLSIFLDPTSSFETKKGAKICLSSIIDPKKGMLLPIDQITRLAQAMGGALYLHPNTFTNSDENNK